jgi:murein DD-endopeptidase MepM/ murein hydrolase activator NlpD
MGRFRLGVTTAAVGFLMGAIALAALAWKFPHASTSMLSKSDARVSHSASPLIALRGGQPAIQARPAALSLPVFENDPIADLRQRRLEMPVQDAPREALRDSFDDARDGTHKHEAIDMLAPRNTPVVAVEDGIIAKLFYSVPGGITVYQFDPTASYAYYYAHLERYADGLAEGAHVTRKQVLGYVGTSGNAPKDTPHLHFAIFKLTDKKQWWRGTPIDPYRVLK